MLTLSRYGAAFHSSDSLASPTATLTLGDLPVTEVAIISHHVGLHTLGRTPPGVMGRHPLVGLAPHGVLNHGISRLEARTLSQSRSALCHGIRPDRRLTRRDITALREAIADDTPPEDE